MAIAQALAMLAGGMSGYAKGEQDRKDEERQAKEEARRAEDDAFRREQRDRQRVEWKRSDDQFSDQQAEKQAAAEAMKPIAVDSAPVPQPIGSRDVVRPPEDMGSRVGGQTFTDPAKADAAAAAYNAPEAGMRRAAAAIRDPARAAQVQAMANQTELAGMQLSAARLKQADEAWDREVVSSVASGGPDGLAKFLSDSKADREGGSVKVQAVYSPDKTKFSFHRVQPDGSTVPMTEEFKNGDSGYARATFMLKRGVPAEKKLEHFDAQAKAEEEARRWEVGQSNNERDYKLREKDSDSRAALRSAQAEAAAARAEAAMARATAGRGAGGSAFGATAPVWDDKASGFLRQRYTITDPNSGQVAVDGVGIDLVKAIALSKSQANGGDIDRALGFAFDRDAQMRAASTDPKSGYYDQAKHNALRKQYMVQVFGGGQPTAAPQPPPAPEQPGVMSRMASTVRGWMDEGSETGRRMESIRARVKDAGAGGKALTDAERAEAKKYGIVPTR